MCDSQSSWSYQYPSFLGALIILQLMFHWFQGRHAVPPLPRLFLSRGSSGLDLFANLVLVHCPRLGGDCPDIWQMGYPWVTPMENIEKYEEFTHGFGRFRWENDPQPVDFHAWIPHLC